MAIFGNDCIVRASSLGENGSTVLDLNNPLSEYGTLTQVCVYVENNTGTDMGKVKVFRTNGDYYDFVGESSSQSIVNGTNTFSGLSIQVQTGDLIAFYGIGTGVWPNDGNVYIRATTSGGSYVSKSGDVTTNTLKSGWSGYSYIVSILATYTPLASDIYVNSSTGSDANAGDSCLAGHPVLTFGKAYSLLNAAGTIHVCNSGADFSAETITRNKSYSMTVDGGGYWYDAKGT